VITEEIKGFPQGLKPKRVLSSFSARLKPCPFKTTDFGTAKTTDYGTAKTTDFGTAKATDYGTAKAALLQDWRFCAGLDVRGCCA
jgi:hypothetical protein